ncbi:MAG: hypothetical protein ATN31_03085 [Candidatus Epulonipiscioides saccharophilum]|nr:MAG: hypothetical protein ATN31_03085 [Epulopiscium sp. AS2M-Bin001]
MKKNEEDNGLKRQLSMTMCITLVMGAIIGSGIFTMTGTAIGYIGKAVPVAFITAAIFIIITNIPSIFQGGALPATGGSYVYVSRFVHPTFGYIHILNLIMGTFNIALMGTSAAMYFQPLMPSIPTKVTAAIFILLLAILGSFGVKISGIVQNIIIIIMIAALLTFIIPGLGAISSEFVTIGEALFPNTLEFAALWSAVAILRYSLMGGGIVFTLGDEVKNPGRTIPASFFIGTALVTLFYCLIGYISVGVAPLEVVANQPLSVSAALILGEHSGAFQFFLVGGALLATLTTLNGSFLIYSRTLYAAAKDLVLPGFLTTTNKFGVPIVAVWVCAFIGLTVVLLELTVTQLLSFVSIPGLLLGFIYYIPPIVISRKLPYCAKNAWFRLPSWLITLISVSSAILLFTLGKSLFDRMETSHYIGMLIFYGLGFVYWFLRLAYLKKQGIDLIANMKGFHPYWIELEEKYKNEELQRIATSDK